MKKIVHTILPFFLLLSCSPKSNLSSLQVTQGHIVGMEGSASIPSFPAIVALTSSSGEIFCSGTLIEADLVLTAAHCITMMENVSLEKRFVFFGDKTDKQTRTGQYFSIAWTKKNNYHPTEQKNPKQINLSRSYDLGFIKLKKPVPIEPKDLPQLSDGMDANFFNEEQKFWSVGFGLDEQGHVGEKKAIEQKLTIDQLISALSLSSPGQPGVISIGTSTRGIREGDSGSGLLTYGQDGKLHIIGVASAYSSIEGYSVYAFSTGVSSWLKSLPLLEKANDYFSQGDYSQSFKLNLSALTLYNSAESMVGLAKSLSRLGKFQESRDVFEKILDKNKKTASILYSYLVELSYQADQQKEDEKIFTSAEFGGVLYPFFDALKERNFTKTDDHKILEDVYSLIKENFKALKYFEMRLVSLGYFDMAAKVSQRMLELAPNDEYARQRQLMDQFYIGDNSVLAQFEQALTKNENSDELIMAATMSGNRAYLESLFNFMGIDQQRKILKENQVEQAYKEQFPIHASEESLKFLAEKNLLTFWGTKNLLEVFKKEKKTKEIISLLNLNLIDQNNNAAIDDLFDWAIALDQKELIIALLPNQRVSDALLAKQSTLLSPKIVVYLIEQKFLSSEILKLTGADLLALAIVNQMPETAIKLIEMGVSLHDKPRLSLFENLADLASRNGLKL